MEGESQINPYSAPAGPELDAAVHRIVMREAANGACPRYSQDEREAEKVRMRIKSTFGLSIVTGKTRVHTKPWFARYSNDINSETEVIAETLPLAICRLALVRVIREG